MTDSGRTLPSRVIYQLAVEKWGVVSQIHMCSEEMSELNKELMKVIREGESESRITSIVDEIADVMIMIEQMVFCFDIRDEVIARKEFKLARLEGLVKKEGKQ